MPAIGLVLLLHFACGLQVAAVLQCLQALNAMHTLSSNALADASLCCSCNVTLQQTV